MIWPLLAACGWPVEPPSHNAAFPHPSDYEASGHGPDSLQPGAACARCHGDDGPGETCASCHAGYPHDVGFDEGASHGPAVDDSCDACHGPSGARAPADVVVATCTYCHTTYPHPEGWEAVSAHGAATLERGTTAACDGCHGAGLAGAACTECHDWPHAADQLTAHGAAWVAGAQDCGGCHDADRPGPTCEGCHIDVPHPEGWGLRGHLPAVQTRGEATCLGCHPAGSLVGPELPQTCASSCHGGGS